MGNNECCGRLKDEDDKFLMSSNNRLSKDQVPLCNYDIKPYAQVINDMCKDMIKQEELKMSLNLENEEETDIFASDSQLMNYLNKLPGKHPNKKIFPRVSLICLGLLFCEGTIQDKG